MLFCGQIATNSDTTHFRRGKPPCEKARAADLAGQKQGENSGKRGKVAEYARFFRCSFGRFPGAAKREKCRKVWNSVESDWPEEMKVSQEEVSRQGAKLAKIEMNDRNMGDKNMPAKRQCCSYLPVSHFPVSSFANFVPLRGRFVYPRVDGAWNSSRDGALRESPKTAMWHRYWLHAKPTLFHGDSLHAPRQPLCVLCAFARDLCVAKLRPIRSYFTSARSHSKIRSLHRPDAPPTRMAVP